MIYDSLKIKWFNNTQLKKEPKNDENEAEKTRHAYTHVVWVDERTAKSYIAEKLNRKQ